LLAALAGRAGSIRRHDSWSRIAGDLVLLPHWACEEMTAAGSASPRGRAGWAGGATAGAGDVCTCKSTPPGQAKPAATANGRASPRSRPHAAHDSFVGCLESHSPEEHDSTTARTFLLRPGATIGTSWREGGGPGFSRCTFEKDQQVSRSMSSFTWRPAHNRIKPDSNENASTLQVTATITDCV